MNQRIDFSNLGGFPTTQKTLDFMQGSYRNAFNGIANLCGQKVIVSGMQVVGDNISAGWISYNGELIPFAAGALSTDVIIQEMQEPATFQDNAVRNVYFTLSAKCGSPGTFPFSDLKRLSSLQNIWLPGDIKEIDCTLDYVQTNFSVTGMGQNERLGWAVRNGQNGTRNAGGRTGVAMIYPAVTFDPNDNVWDAIYNTPGSTYGEKKHVLSVNEMPVHNHTFQTGGDNQNDDVPNGYVYGRQNADNRVENHASANAGGGAAHENRQPLIVTLSIVKL